MISIRGKLDCLAAYGTADRASGRANTPKTAFGIGSITKAFTAAAILDLADAGKLSLSDRAGDVLPELRGPVADATVRQLLLQTSGLKGSHGEDHKPLGHFEGPFWAVDGNGGLAMTMRDLADWAHALFTGEIVSPQAVEAITTPGFKNGGGLSETPGWVAYDKAVFGQPFFATAGGGAS